MCVLGLCAMAKPILVKLRQQINDGVRTIVSTITGTIGACLLEANPMLNKRDVESMSWITALRASVHYQRTAHEWKSKGST